VPASTRHPFVPGVTERLVRSRTRMSLRVSQPFRLVSSQACPTWSRSYPVCGARPLTDNPANTPRAVPAPGRLVRG
jgi:hypothetical protein